ncbi:Protein sprouty-like 4 [Cricetulus griseus]|uniref:Protein sprouty-like 4 n=1 Tax=Cricetulus griseus TaxID=10029 RepID=G3HWB5_CRIGR
MKTSHVENDYIENLSLTPTVGPKQTRGGVPELAPTLGHCDQNVTHPTGSPSAVGPARYKHMNNIIYKAASGDIKASRSDKPF